MNTTAPTGLLQQPRPFFMIFFVELWERFGYYGVQGILAVFFVKQRASLRNRPLSPSAPSRRWFTG